ncbi:MAG: CHAT domain-containing protein [Synechococcaceae cyanobacterium RL_1_2]|nr:CHAT domain-containing protein [Synechococcaceae cyanobacterium RL_1_2]
MQATRRELLILAQRMRAGVTNVRRKSSFLRPSQAIYNLIIKPLEEELEAQQITNIGFLMDRGLRGIPIAALHDGEDFIIANYSVGLMPSLSMSELDYVDLKNDSVLAMGADTFVDQFPLPAVPIEVETISNKIWQGTSFLNEAFTIENLTSSRANATYGILHLATHAEFNPGTPADSYIQLGNQKLSLDELNELGLNDPPMELIVLSACRTALGNDDAEMGFAGLALMAGVKSALGSLWNVSDEGTLSLMTNFYHDLRFAPTKTEALRRAQLSMLNGEVYITNGQLITPDGPLSLPPELSILDDRNFSHPYYWSGFTMIGSPW